MYVIGTACTLIIGQHLLVREAFDYIQEQVQGQHFDAIIGFSQGGTLAASLALTGIIPGVRAVVTAGAPYVEEAFLVAREIGLQKADDGSNLSSTSTNGPFYTSGLKIPKLHLAGERDEMVAVYSTQQLSLHGGSGIVEIHDQGHLFPTRAVPVNKVLNFLEATLST